MEKGAWKKDNSEGILGDLLLWENGEGHHEGPSIAVSATEPCFHDRRPTYRYMYAVRF
jgi:hypothetical protein